MDSRRLTLEPLERRDLVAVAEFYVDLYDDAGDPVEAVTVGKSFFAEITVREFDPIASGLQAVSLDIAWDSAVIMIGDSFSPETAITDKLPWLRDCGKFDGRLDNLGGLSFPGIGVGYPIGNLAPERFVLIPFEAVAVGETSIEMNQGKGRINPMPSASLRSEDLRFEPFTVTVLPNYDYNGDTLINAVDVVVCRDDVAEGERAPVELLELVTEVNRLYRS